MPSRRLLVIMALPGLLLVVGTVGYAAIEDWTPLSALYMTAITISTVGFREVGPLSETGQVFTILMIVGGVLTITYAGTEIVRSMLEGELRELFGFAPKVQPEHVVYIGLRDVVDEERQTIRELGIKAYGMSEIERLGISQICEETFTRMNESTDGFVLSFDIDALDPLFAPAVDYPQPGGLTTREAMVIMEFAHRAPGLKLLEILVSVIQ